MRAVLLGVLVLSVSSVQAVDRKAVNAAIERGVNALKRAQNDDGSWHNTTLGATALAGLTLVECDVPRSDPSVKKAAEYVRKHALTSTHVYSLALSILFLDRLGYARDTPLIESMIVRLLAGQKKGGAWSYDTPPLSDLEMKRILGEMDGSRVLRAGGDLKKLPERGKRTLKDLPESVRDQLVAIERGLAAPDPGGVMSFGGGDNSNTQFAVLALWTGRRYGVPTQPALVRAYEYFRRTQNAADGGWGYTAAPPGIPTVGGSTATMTCAGVLALAVGQGSAAEIKKRDSADVSKDAGLKAGLQLLGANIGHPIGWDGLGPKPAVLPSAPGKSYYFLWSLERICVALNLATIGKKDWYNWGAEILLANQAADGNWAGDYATYHADTCFALLFLKRSNLAADLGEKITGLKDPGDRRLRAGGELAGPGVKDPPLAGGTEKPGKETKPGEKPVPPERKPEARPVLELPSRTPQEREARQLAADLLQAKSPEQRGELLQKLRDTKGVTYTEALVAAIYGLEGEAKRDARQALTARLTRMKETTLTDYLLDEEPEIRRAAALASGTKQISSHVSILIKLLRDPQEQVRKAAHVALKATTKQPFDLLPEAWEKWYRENRRE